MEKNFPVPNFGRAGETSMAPDQKRLGTRTVERERLADQLHRPGASALERYRAKAVGDVSIPYLIGYELRLLLFGGLPGGIGYLLRKHFLASLFGRAGSGLILGKGLSLRHPARFFWGNRVAIDDHCMVDAGGGEIRVGDDVIVSRNCVLQAKTGPLTIGNRTDIGCNAVLSAISGIDIGESVLLAANVYVGGARYVTDRPGVPFMDQGSYSRGPISIGSGSWLGAGAIVLDGVAIGERCVVGAGGVVTRDLPSNSVAAGIPARIVGSAGGVKKIWTKNRDAGFPKPA
jgi:acetyltransferase-like isoleucine patch superfamily enzyme